MRLSPVALLLLVDGLLVAALPSATQRFRHLFHPYQQPIFHSATPHTKPLTRLDAASNSVGMLFTTSDDEEVTHIWFPLGKRLYTRDSSELPLHPTTARITTMIRSTPEIATPEHLDRVFCMVYPRYNSTVEVPDPDALAVLVRRADDLVRLNEVSARPWKEIESYLCW